MKGLLITIIFGGLAYFIFFYETSDPTEQVQQNQQISENQKILEEEGIQNKTYQGAITETYDSIKSKVQDAKDAVSATEKRYQGEY